MERRGVGGGEVEGHDFAPAGRAGDERHRAAGERERVSKRLQRGRRGPPVLGRRHHPDHQCAVVFATDARRRSAGTDMDGDAHGDEGPGDVSVR